MSVFLVGIKLAKVDDVQFCPLQKYDFESDDLGLLLNDSSGLTDLTCSPKLLPEY